MYASGLWKMPLQTPRDQAHARGTCASRGNAVCPHGGISLGLREERDSETRCDVGGLEGVVLSEVSQSQRDTHRVTPVT